MATSKRPAIWTNICGPGRQCQDFPSEGAPMSPHWQEFGSQLDEGQGGGDRDTVPSPRSFDLHTSSPPAVDFLLRV